MMFGEERTRAELVREERIEALNQAVKFSVACAAAGAVVTGMNVRITAASFAEFLADGTKS